MKRITVMGSAFGLALAVASCAQEGEIVEPAPEGTIEGISIENARMVLAPVEGNPAAIYFDFAYAGDRAFSLDRFAVEGAESATMHQFGEYDFKVQMMEALPIPVKDGTSVEFKPGDYHVMAFNPSPELKPGGTTEVILTVSGGDKHKFDAEIRAAGEER